MFFVQVSWFFQATKRLPVPPAATMRKRSMIPSRLHVCGAARRDHLDPVPATVICPPPRCGTPRRRERIRRPRPGRAADVLLDGGLSVAGVGADLCAGGADVGGYRSGGSADERICKALRSRRETIGRWEAGLTEPRPPRRAASAWLLQAFAATRARDSPRRSARPCEEGWARSGGDTAARPPRVSARNGTSHSRSSVRYLYGRSAQNLRIME